MSELSAKKSIQRLLQINQTILLEDIVRFDVQRTFVHISRSSLTPPTGYYFVAILVENKRKRKILDPINDLGIKLKQYRINLTLVDYIHGVTGEDELYEFMTDDFNTVTDRIIELIDPDDVRTYFFDGANRFRLVEDTEVSCDNTPVYWEEAETYHAVLIADITFEIEEC